jgi:flagellar biosynthesis/type III secretory pathway protein FliH
MSEEGLEDPGIDANADRLREAFEEHGTWRAVALVAEAIRDAREKKIVDRVEHYLEHLIETTGQENPSLTVKDVRRRLFEVPQ